MTVGGSGVGGHLLRRVIAAFPEAKERVPGLRMIVVAGPQIDPASLPAQEGLEIRPYVPDLYRHLAACDLAVVRGGLTTTMELTASRRPFLYFPLCHHFEQNLHVRHRLDRYRAGWCMDYQTAGPSDIAAAIASEIGRPVDYRPVAADCAARAASLLASVLLATNKMTSRPPSCLASVAASMTSTPVGRECIALMSTCVAFSAGDAQQPCTHFRGLVSRRHARRLAMRLASGFGSHLPGCRCEEACSERDAGGCDVDGLQAGRVNEDAPERGA